ncbi:hypothetical protein DPMN_154906 [Dreissena polymorpha]|uniref:Uncharacterized protein n=1 Tax=Dreissena polymorpha TaxID=45954 RepID=A0A9D4J9J9_DREPO|nr:hypothetical protein DPMN_154906 [Dreissena polymorpha]
MAGDNNFHTSMNSIPGLCVKERITTTKDVSMTHKHTFPDLATMGPGLCWPLRLASVGDR